MLVRLEVVHREEGVRVAEGHLRVTEPHLGAGQLGEEVGVDGAGVGEVDHEPVPALRARLGVEREDPQRGLAVADRDHLAALGEALAGAKQERHALPAPVVDLAAQRDERLGLRVRRNARLGAVTLVLAAHHVLDVDRDHGLEDLDHLVAQRLRAQRGRRLHRHDAHQLEEVGHDHVPERPGLLEERGAALDREGLGDVDLHVGDVVAVPDGLEEPVREPQREDVVDRLLSQEVVDPEDLGLVEARADGLVERAGGREVAAERLLADDLGVLVQAARPEHLDHRGEGRRGHGEVVQEVGVAADLALRGFDRLHEPRGVVRLGDPEREHRLEAVPVAPLGLEAPELGDGAARVGPERVRRHRELLGRGSHDPAPDWQEPGHAEVEQSWDQLALGEVAGGAEQDDDVVLGPLDAMRRRTSHQPSPPGADSSTVSPRPTSTLPTILGAKRPWSTTPGIESSHAARAAGSDTSPR